MTEPPITPTFSPKRGLTKEEQRKVKAFIKAGKMKKCPAVGSPELIAMGLAKYRKWLATVGEAMKVKLGLVPLKDKKPEEQKREERNAYHREYRRQNLDKIRKYNRKEGQDERGQDR